MSVTLTYRTQAFTTLAFFKRLVSIRPLFGLVMAAALLAPVSAYADNESFGFSRLAPPKSKFKLPSLGDISIWKNDMQKAKRAYREGKYDKARKYLHKALKGGNFLAAWYLGHIHRLGLGVPVNRGKAFHFYRTVALEYDDRDMPRRMFLIVLDSLVKVADGYRTGIKSGGVKRDHARAMRLYSKAANRGHPGAQYGLARMFLSGQGVKPNPRKAVRWFRLSARKRFPPALAMLGDFSDKGTYLRKSKIRAVAMYIVATTGTNEALYPNIFDRLDQLSRQLTDEEYQRSQELARRWMRKNDLVNPARASKRFKAPSKNRQPSNLFRSVAQPAEN